MSTNKNRPTKASLPKKFIKYVNENGDTYQGSQEFLDELDTWPEKAARANTNVVSIEQLCELIGIEEVQVPWCKSATYVEHLQGVGKTTEHANGLCYVGDPAAMLLVECLDVPRDAFVIDMCGAPGGKSAHVLNYLSNKATLISNDIDFRRARILKENLSRMTSRMNVDEIPNFKVLNMNTSDLADRFESKADIVILDAPCSGEAMMRRSDIARRQWSEKLVDKMSILQKQLLFHGARMLKPGGVLGYSTCTFNRIENEEVVNFGINNLPLSPIDISKNFQMTNEVIKRSSGLAIFPHLSKGDGQVVHVMSRSL